MEKKNSRILGGSAGGIVLLVIVGSMWPETRWAILGMFGVESGGVGSAEIALEHDGDKTYVVGRCPRQPDSPITLVVRGDGEEKRCQVAGYIVVEPSGEFRREVPEKYLGEACEIYVVIGKKMVYDKSIEVPGSNVEHFDPERSG
ncbi:MAG: hypothetical protein ACYTEX_24190 [Planctomycetota bacterium]|jgi:hypothetical protein